MYIHYTQSQSTPHAPRSYFYMRCSHALLFYLLHITYLGTYSLTHPDSFLLLVRMQSDLSPSICSYLGMIDGYILYERIAVLEPRA